ncbi:MAG: 4Fe-4S binding protein, partial [Deltaproteobacteria bacterium]|nr:4Fe-4S binding protein [Deltaproteobacteria bacterium]
MMIPIIAVVLPLNLLYSRFYCRYFCPVGAFFNLFNMIALKFPWRRRHRFPACFYGVKNGDDFECMQCNRCLGATK